MNGECLSCYGEGCKHCDGVGTAELSESSLNDLLSDLLDIVEKSEFKKSEICKATGLGFCRMKEKRETVVEEAKNYLGR